MKLQFACGATVEANDASTVGKQVIVTTTPAIKQSYPEMDGRRMPCLFGCPAKVKDSKRKAIRVLELNGEKCKGVVVLCKVKRAIE